MKKLLAITLVIALLFSFSFSLGSSAVKNLLPIDDETSTFISHSAYMPDYGPDKTYPIPSWGSWISGGEKLEDFGIPMYIKFDTETVKFGSKSVYLEMAGKDYPHMCASIYLDASALEAGKTYTFQAYAKLSKVMSATEGCGIEVGCLTNEHTVVNGWENKPSEYISGTKDWTLLSATFVAPEGENLIMSFTVKLWSCMTGKAWFDGFALVEGDKAVADYSTLDAISGGTAEPTKDPTPTEAPKPDVPSDWAKDEVAKAVEAKLVPEHINSKFTSNITRSDFCDLIINMITTKTGKAIADVIAEYADKKDGITFPDTTSENVLAAAALGIVNGRSSGAFDPDASITRQEAAKMLTLAAKVLGADTTASDVEFADAADIFAWAKEFINYVNSIDVMKGTNTATPPNFSPTKNYTREQSILTVYRLFNAIGK